MNNYSVAEITLIEVAHFLDPLRSLNTSSQVLVLLERLGYSVPATDLVNSFTQVSSKTEKVIENAIKLIKALTDDEKLQALTPLLLSVTEALDELIKLEASLRSAPGMAQNFIDNAPLDKLPKRLLDFLLFQNLYRRYPKIFGTLHLMGVLEEEILTKDEAIFQPDCRLKIVRWERIPRYLSEPGKVIDEIYGWNSDFNSDEFFIRFSIFLRAMAVAGGIYQQSNNVKNALGNTTPNLSELRIPVFSAGFYPEQFSQFGFNITPAEASSEKKKGLAILPYLYGTANFNFEFSEGWEAVLQSSLNIDAGIGLILRPPLSMEFLQNIFTSPEDAASLGFALGVQQKGGSGNETREFFLFGTKKNTHLSVTGISLKFFGNLNSPGDDAGIELEIKKIHLLFTLGGADSFIGKTLPQTGIQADFALGIGFSLLKAVYFKGSARVEVLLPVHIELGPIHIEGITVAILLKDSQIPVEVSSNIKAKLGPIQAVIENIGLASTFSFPRDGNGKLGPVDFGLSFKPPRGVGLVIDAGAVVGGGYLFFDYDNGQYGGILQIEVKGTVSIKVIGLITTKMPDGSPGFSLLFIITVEFSPIQLGYGFTLNGVGGLAGFNRTMMVDALRDGIKNRTLDSILFPPDPIKNARKIISDLQTVFPPAPGRFVFAPMVKLGWGAGMLLIEVGLAVELPWPLRLAILGKLHLQLPPAQQGGQQEENIIQLHMDVLGILDFDRGEVSVDAVLYDSLLVIFPITGGMAMRIRWGSNPLFMMSVGGLNPRFPQPPDFPTLDRLGLQLSYEESGIKARLRLISYFAVTPNTLQFGARLDAYVDVSKVAQIEAFMGFDALIEFHPFHFIVDLYGGVSVRAFGFTFGVDLLLTLSGPKPFNGDGHAIVNFLGKHEVAVHFAIGEEPAENPALPPVDPLVELMAAFEDLSNWSAALPAAGNMLVTVRQLSQDELKGKVLAHPLGELTVRQRVLPLGVALERFGASVPTSPGPFELHRVYFGNQTDGITPTEEGSLRDAFAPGQYLNLTEDEKLTRPAFESFLCGQTRIGTESIKTPPTGAIQRVDFEYEVTVIDDKEAKEKRSSQEYSTLEFVLEENAFLRAAQYGAAKQSPMQSLGSAKFAGIEQGIKVREPEYVVAGMDDLQSPGSGVFPTFTEAEAARRSGGQAAQQVVEAYEVN